MAYLSTQLLQVDVHQSLKHVNSTAYPSLKSLPLSLMLLHPTQAREFYTWLTTPITW